MRKSLMLVAAVVVPSVLFACGGSKPAAPGAAAAAPAPAAAPAESAAAPAATAVVADAIGVPECDNYVKKYMECVGSKVPEVARAQYKAAFDQAVAAWKQVAATPEGRSGLAAACTQAQTAAAQAMTSYGCTF